MLKKLMLVISLSLLFIACNNQKEDNKPEETTEIPELTLANFHDGTELKAEQEVWVTGNVVHTCRHSGKKMFIVDENGDNKLRIDAGGEISEFDVALEGSKVKVKGIVEEERIDDNYLNEWESELKAEGESEAIGEGGCTEEQPEDYDEEKTQHENQMNRIKELRARIAENGKGYVSFYSLKAVEMEKL